MAAGWPNQKSAAFPSFEILAHHAKRQERAPSRGSTVESEAGDIESVLRETERSRMSEREGRLGDGEDGGSLEAKKQEGYF